MLLGLLLLDNYTLVRMAFAKLTICINEMQFSVSKEEEAVYATC